MRKSVLALGLDPSFADFTQFPHLTPELVRAFSDSQLAQLRGLGYEVCSCLVDLGETAEAVTVRRLEARSFDCVMFGAGLRAPPRLLLFEKLINLVHERAPNAKICFNTTPAGRQQRCSAGSEPGSRRAGRRNQGECAST
jgi:hypothetical protein